MRRLQAGMIYWLREPRGEEWRCSIGCVSKQSVEAGVPRHLVILLCLSGIFSPVPPFPSAEGTIVKHSSRLWVEYPVVTFARPALLSWQLDEALIERKVMSYAVFPSLFEALFIIGEAFSNKSAYLRQSCPLHVGAFYSHGNQCYIGERRLGQPALSSLEWTLRHHVSEVCRRQVASVLWLRVMLKRVRSMWRSDHWVAIHGAASAFLWVAAAVKGRSSAWSWLRRVCR